MPVRVLNSQNAYLLESFDDTLKEQGKPSNVRKQMVGVMRNIIAPYEGSVVGWDKDDWIRAIINRCNSKASSQDNSLPIEAINNYLGKTRLFISTVIDEEVNLDTWTSHRIVEELENIRITNKSGDAARRRSADTKKAAPVPSIPIVFGSGSSKHEKLLRAIWQDKLPRALKLGLIEEVYGVTD